MDGNGMKDNVQQAAKRWKKAHRNWNTLVLQRATQHQKYFCQYKWSRKNKRPMEKQKNEEKKKKKHISESMASALKI